MNFHLFLIPLFTTTFVFASTLKIDALYNSFQIRVLSTNCYPPAIDENSDIPLLEFNDFEFVESVCESIDILSEDDDLTLLTLALEENVEKVCIAMNFCSDYLTLLKDALDDGVDFNVLFLPDLFPIHFSILSNRKGIFDLLVGNVDVNQEGLDGLTLLHYALEVGNFYFIENLLYNGADPYKFALLEWDDAVVVEGYDVNHVDRKGQTALAYPSYFGDTSAFKLLIESGFNCKHVDNIGQTALFYASVYDHKSTVELLIKNNCNLDHKDYAGRTAYNHAIKNGHKNMAEFLVENGCTIVDADRCFIS